MSLGQLLASGAAAVFNPGMFLMVCVAIILGTIFGALPGVSATMAVALGGAEVLHCRGSFLG